MRNTGAVAGADGWRIGDGPGSLILEILWPDGSKPPFPVGRALLYSWLSEQGGH
jgi:hypothetical protein